MKVVPRRPRLLFVVNVDAAFLSHRVALACAARQAGFEVSVAGADSGRSEAIRRLGFEFFPIPISRKGLNPVQEAITLYHLARLYRRLRPDVIHHLTLKPILYGSLAARSLPDLAVVNGVTGLGYLFTESGAARLLRPLVKRLLCVALAYRYSGTIFQNPEDREEFVRSRLVSPDRAVLIRGSGVNCSVFEPRPEPRGTPIVMLAARLLWDKGVKEFVDAARTLVAEGLRARFVLVGSPDPGNPRAVPEDWLDRAVEQGWIEWWGKRDDMPAVLSAASVVVLPTKYPEGVPKVLLEAAACSRPIVATDVPGCREIVRPGVNGLLVPPGDSAVLADAIRELLQSAELRARLGRAGREIVVAEFTDEIVIQQILEVYYTLLSQVASRTSLPPVYPCALGLTALPRPYSEGSARLTDRRV